MNDPVELVNAIFWVFSNILVVYIAFALVVFTIGYFAIFDPYQTRGGGLIFRFTASLIGVIGLVVLSTFVDPPMGRSWLTYPNDVVWWRPALRFLVYLGVAYTITRLSIHLAISKWWPEKVRTYPDETTLVRPRKRKTNRK